VRAHALESLLLVGDDQEAPDTLETLAATAMADHKAALNALLEHLRSPAHKRLMTDLTVYAAEPPLSNRGREHPQRVTRQGLQRAVQRVALRCGTGLEERHKTRKAARRLRYAAEAAADDFGRKAVRLAAAAEAVQDALGVNRDAVLLARFLRGHDLTRLADRADREAAAALQGIDASVQAIPQIFDRNANASHETDRDQTRKPEKPTI
jgi:CHAD domain-containing protein